jgi:hypothetical protein
MDYSINQKQVDQGIDYSINLFHKSVTGRSGYRLFHKSTRAEPVSLTFHSALRKLNTEPSIGASHQISAHFGKTVSEEKIFRNPPI